MIRDLEKEVVAVRNLTENVSYVLEALLVFVEEEKSLQKSKYLKDLLNSLKKEKKSYFEHRCARFDQEVEDAQTVLNKS